jgi:hypothetical protein
MEKIIVELEAKTDKALKGIDNVAKSVEDLNKEVVGSNKATEKSLKGVEKTSKSVAGGVRKIGGALKAIGIGLVIAALSTLKDMFEGNQKAVDFFNVAFETASIVVGQVVTAITNVYEAVAKSSENFNALGKVMSGLLTIAVTPLKLGFFGIKLAIQQAQLIWEQSFFGGNDNDKIAALTIDILETKNALYDVGEAAIDASKDIVTNFVEAASEVGDIGSKVIEEVGKISVSAALETAKVNTELTKSAELAAATQGLLFEKFDRQAEKLRQIRDEERNSITDRKKANDDLLIAVNEAEQAMLSQAKQQLAIANANLKKDSQNIEFKVAQIEALKELAGVEAQIEGIRSEQKANDLALSREQIELTNSKAAADSELSIAKRKFAAEQILSEQLRLEKLIEINEAEKEIEATRLQAIVDNANAGTQAKIDAQIALDEFVNTNNEENATLKKDLGLQEVSDAKAVANAKKAIQMGNLSNVASGFALLSQLAGKNKALQAAALIGESAVGIAKTVISTQAANAAAVLKYALLPGGLALAKAESAMNNVSAGIGIATNIAATAKGLSSLGGGGSTPSSPSLSSVGGGGAPQPPAFNVVGASDTNQLAGAIGNQSQQPIETYVVSGNVSTSQELDRNIVTGASI